VRKSKFSQYPGVIPELDLIEEKDKIIHNVSLDDEFDPEENANFFKVDPEFQDKETQWDEIKKEILGEYYGTNLAVAAGMKPNPDASSGDEESSDLGDGAATMIDPAKVRAT